MTSGRLRAFSERDASEWIRTVEEDDDGHPRPWLLIDADRTLAEADASRELAIQLGVNDAICAGFKRLGYCDTAFSRAALEFSAIPAAHYEHEARRIGRDVRLRRPFLDVLEATRGQVHVTVVTAGSPTLWREALVANGMHGLPVLGGCHRELDPWFVGANSKAILTQALVSRGAFVAAAGDGLLDGPMLEAATLPLFVPDRRGSAALLEVMRDITACRHLVVDDRRFSGIRPIHPGELIATLSAQRGPA